MNTITPARETKRFHFSVKAIDDEQGLIEAYGSVFDNIDQGDDVVRPGAFKRTIQNSKARVKAGKANFLAMMLWNHDIEHFLPIGGWYDLQEDAHGLLGKGKIILDTQLGRDVYTLIKEKVIDEFSIGYDIPSGGAFYDKSTGNRNLTELRLWEISPVVFAMNQEALLVGVKNNNQGKHMQKKTFQEAYQSNQAQDLLEDWQDIILSALTCAVMDAFKIGDTPMDDIKQALDGFNAAVTMWAQQGIDCNLSQYLTDNAYFPSDNTAQNGSSAGYDGYMASTLARVRKSGRAISAANAQAIQSTADMLHAMADKAMDMMKEHTKAVHTAADDLATVLQGSEAAYGTDAGDAGDRQEGKSTSASSQTRAPQVDSLILDTPSEEELARSYSWLKSLSLL